MSKVIYKPEKNKIYPKGKYHTFETHNFHMNRYKHCLYCDNNSIPTLKCFLNKDGTWNERAIKKAKWDNNEQ